MAETSATPTLTLASRSAWNRLVVGDAPLADTSSPAPGGCRISGFYPFHPVALTEPEPAGGCHPLLPVIRFRFASEPSLVPGYVSNSRPASALELKRRLFLQPADILRRSGNVCLPCPLFQPKLSEWLRRRPEGLRRLEEPPMRRLTSRSQRPSGNRHDRPKVATAVPRMPRLPFASAPMSEDTAAGYEPPARHGLAGDRLRLRNGYPPRCAQRPGVDGPSEDRGSEEPTPSTDLTYRVYIPSSEDFGCFPGRRPFPFTL